MNIHAEKASENKSQAHTNGGLKQPGYGAPAYAFTDNRPETLAQQKLQKTLSQSPQVNQLRAYQDMADAHSAGSKKPVQKKANHTGLPDTLKSGIENLSGYSMDDVNVHYHSDKPAQLNAHAYAQGTDIHIAPGQERHLPHEAWHVVQQKQGRVKPTLQMKNKVNVNDDAGLEHEADVMGSKALQTMPEENGENPAAAGLNVRNVSAPVAQRFIGLEFQMLRSDIEMDELTGGGELNGWKPSDDGSGEQRNLELETTEFFTDKSKLTRTVTEMAALGRRMADSYKGEQIDIGNHRITVNKPDNSGQPQVTFDLPLSSFGPDLANKSTELMKHGYFNADMPGFGWPIGKTSEDMQTIMAFLSETQTLISDKVIDTQYKKLQKGDEWPPALYEQIRSYIAACFTQHYQAATKKGGLTKDVHLLLKTDTTQLEEAILEKIKECADPSLEFELDIDEFFSKTNTNLLVSIGKKFNIKLNPKEMRANLYDTPRAPKKDSKDKLGAALELRRVSVKPVSEWVPFAQDAFQRLNDLFHPQANDEDDDSSLFESGSNTPSHSDEEEENE